jgi:hypothetical protein
LPFYILGYLVFVYIPPVIEGVLIRRPDLFVAWSGLFLLMIARFLEWQSSLFHRDRMPVFDDGEEQTRLGLAEWSPRDLRPDVAGLKPCPTDATSDEAPVRTAQRSQRGADRDIARRVPGAWRWHSTRPGLR